jgi:hypothetical protein
VARRGARTKVDEIRRPYLGLSGAATGGSSFDSSASALALVAREGSSRCRCIDGKIGSPHDKKRAVSSRLSVIAFELALGYDRGFADRGLADRGLADHGGRGLAGRQICGGSSAHESER